MPLPQRHALILFRQRTASRGSEQASIISTLCAASAQAAGPMRKILSRAARAVLTRAASGVPARDTSQAGAADLHGARRSQDGTRHRAGGPALLQRGVHGRQHERLLRREEKVEGASGAANGGLAGLRCTCDIANSMLMKASTRDIMMCAAFGERPDRARRGQHRDFSTSHVDFTPGAPLASEPI